MLHRLSRVQRSLGRCNEGYAVRVPGTRLTKEDRRTIAAGLAAGLPYAEIARRLGRPTSTVSREIARNGGPHGYRADRAQEATTVRGRRMPGPAASGSGFEEQLVAMMIHTGLPRMPARVLAALLTCDEPHLSAADLVARVRVSPASVSKAVTYLEQLELLRRTRGPRDRYHVDDYAWYRSCRREADLCHAWADSARTGAALLAGSPAAARLSAMGAYFDHVGRDLADSAERWRHVFGGRRAAEGPPAAALTAAASAGRRDPAVDGHHGPADVGRPR